MTTTVHPDSIALLGLLIILAVVLIHLVNLRRARRQWLRRIQRDSIFCRKQAD